MPDVAAPATTAPPADPVRAALADPEVGARLLALARSILRRPGVDHDDVVQTAVRRALANSHKFDPEAGSVTAWLTGFLRNVAREQVKQQSAAPHTDGDLDRLPAPRPDETGGEDLRTAVRRSSPPVSSGRGAGKRSRSPSVWGAADCCFTCSRATFRRNPVSHAVTDPASGSNLWLLASARRTAVCTTSS